MIPKLPSVVLQPGGADGPGGIVMLLVWAVVVLVVVAGVWKTFVKAGRPGWAAIIPVYNLYVMLDIGDNEWWWLLVIIFVPILNIYGMYKMFAGVSRAFGQGIGFALGLWFLGVVFWPLLGFGDYAYRGSSV